jgi:hypothetical protein
VLALPKADGVTRAREVVDAVVDDLMDRRGIKVPFHELEDDDPATFEEMKRELAEVVAQKLVDEEALRVANRLFHMAYPDELTREQRLRAVLDDGQLLAGRFIEDEDEG